MRLVFDLFPCQTASRRRGIGRYTQSLAESMLHLQGQHDVFLLANQHFPDSVDELRQQFGAMVNPGHFSTYTHTPLKGFGTDHPNDLAVAAALVHHAYQAIAPDVVLYAGPFEDEAVVPFPHETLPSALRVAILYDLIPCLFPEQYLNSPSLKQWYEHRLSSLHKFDLLLAISEATRQDAIRILGIPPERVVNIGGAASDMFRPLPHAERSNIARFGISRPFVLYTGNADYRKNQDGMLRAYAELPAALRASHQLVLNQVGDRDSFDRRIKSLGLSDNDVIVTGHISDQDLISLYNECKVFVFPSLYEGFGLPALEAMACGAPVIAANNSSIPEVMGRSDVLFNAADPTAIAAALEHVLADAELRSELSRYGIERAKTFSWQRTAALAWNAIEEHLRIRSTSAVTGVKPSTPRSCIAVFLPALQPEDRVARHCKEILEGLAAHFDIDIFTDHGAARPGSEAIDQFPSYHHTAFAERRDRYSTVVYQIANEASYAFMLPLMAQHNGVVVLHDALLDKPAKSLTENLGKPLLLAEEILHAHGLSGLIRYVKQGEQSAALSFNRRVLESANQLILAGANPMEALPCHENSAAWMPPVTRLQPNDTPSNVNHYIKVIQSAILADDSQVIKRIAECISHMSPDDTTLQKVSRIAARNWRLRNQPRLLIDVTQLAKSDARTGIQRVVRNIAYEIVGLEGMQCPVELVHQVDGTLWRASKVIGSIFDIPASSVPEQQIVIHPGDTLLMIDSSWEQYRGFLPIFQTVRELGGKIVTVIYDIIPLRTPELCVPALVTVFRTWFRLAVEESDTLLCISRATADEVKIYLNEQNIQQRRRLSVLHWPLGGDIAVRTTETAVREPVRQMAADNSSPLFLMVGTLEPRKGHQFTLDAFEELWRNGSNVRLCIAGSVGWIDTKTIEQIRNHPLLNTKLFFVESFTDAEIEICYAAATALIAASVAEGFGLPIVEAALHNVPTLASDIPVFREVGGDGARYFSLADSRYLAEAVIEFSTLTPQERLGMAAKIRTVTWRQSAERLLSAIGLKNNTGNLSSSGCQVASESINVIVSSDRSYS